MRQRRRGPAHTGTIARSGVAENPQPSRLAAGGTKVAKGAKMPSLGRAPLAFTSAAASFVVCLLATACSSTGSGDAADAQTGGEAEPPDGTPGDSLGDGLGPDGTPSDGMAPDANDGGVWAPDSTGFTLVSSGGLPGPSDAGCPGNDGTFQYDVATRVLAHTGCIGGRHVEASVNLDGASAAELASSLSGLTAHGPTSSCGADAPNVVLTVLGAGNAKRDYFSDFYSGCTGFDAGAGPFVDFVALEGIVAQLGGYLSACPPLPSGTGSGDAGATCVSPSGDGGTADAANQD
jgi:hypothetical protein